MTGQLEFTCICQLSPVQAWYIYIFIILILLILIL